MTTPGFIKVYGYFDEAAEKWAIDLTVSMKYPR